MSRISSKSQSHKNRTNRSRRMFLGLEQLENRRCFNVDFGVSDNGHTLEITGDRANDSIAVVQDSSGVHVTANSERTHNFSNIERIVLSSGGGDDAVTLRTAGDFNFRNVDVEVNLGEGNDMFDGFITQAPSEHNPPDDLKSQRIAINAGQGDDYLNLRTAADFNFRNLDVAISLGAGNDKFEGAITRTTVSEHNPPMFRNDLADKMTIDAGAGDDNVSLKTDADFHFRSLAVTVNLGEGNDTFDEVYSRSSIADAIPSVEYKPQRLSVDAGAGSDFLKFSATTERGSITPVDFNFYKLDISANLGAGNDRLDGIFGNQMGLRLNVDAGAGDDSVNFQLLGSNGELVPAVRPSAVELNFSLGAGDDTLNTLIGGSTGELVPAVMPSTITMRIDGGEGNDRISNTFRNINLNGRVNLNADGGSGNDRIQETFDHARINAGLDMEVLGGAGNDELLLMGQSRVSLDAPFDPSFIAMSQVRMRFDGGAGNDHLLGDIVPCILPAGTLDMIFAGGEGDDVFDFNFRFEDTSKSTTPFGAIRISFQGGAGTDQLRLRMLNAQNPASPITVRLDGIERLV